VLAQALTELGHATTTAEAIERYIGLHWADTRAAIEARIGRALPETFKEDTGAAFASRVDGVVAVPGIHAFLEALPDLPKAVASSSPVSWLRSSLERFGLARHFGTHLYSAAEHVGRGKPFPDIYLHAARALGAKPSEVLVLEDTMPGVKAARAAGMTVVGLCAGTHCGLGYGERLRSAGAHLIASTYTEVLEFIHS
jgi:HAD superfamily hydrolase (TIGR01509 family)